ncbi:fimbria/pilus periplasmic chaperone [Orbus wheelerorum]|uniref:fimbrial biogenesis chaperone n=1 Tax=Orbus wheelerorum TaxID=3074111 RepID=UPI00370DDFB7
MTRLFIMIMVLLSFYSIAGVTVLGTRFIVSDKTKHLNIRLQNDDEGDFLIKTSIACNTNDEFIVSPPLFILPKNTKNIVTIIPSKIEKNNQDHLCKLSIATIPKSPMISNGTVSLAIRSNLHLIYRHDSLKNVNFEQLKLIKKANNQFYLKNSTDFVLSLIISLSKDNQSGIKKTISPNELIPVSICQNSQCNLWISIIDDDDESIIQIINRSTL